MKVALVGCGFVADLYMANLLEHPSLTVAAAMDVVPAHADRFGAYWKIPVFHDAASLLAGAEFDLVLNLTNPHAHYEVSRAFLTAGKHVYSEKPIALDFSQAKALVELAQDRGLHFTAAPCNHLSEAAQTLKRAIDARRIGRPLVAYAEMDDGLLARSPYRAWRSRSGIPWPYEDEFEVGCTLEHAGYSAAWLMLLFGPVRRVVGFATLAYPGKSPGGGSEGADFSLAALEFHSGVVARLTTSNVTPRDHAFRVMGDEGVIYAKDAWFYDTPVHVRRYARIRRRFFLSPLRRAVRHLPCGPKTNRRGAGAMDFARGPAEMAKAIEEGRRSLVPADFALHVNEVVLAIHHARERPADYLTTTGFEPLPAMTAPIL